MTYTKKQPAGVAYGQPAPAGSRVEFGASVPAGGLLPTPAATAQVLLPPPSGKAWYEWHPECNGGITLWSSQTTLSEPDDDRLLDFLNVFSAPKVEPVFGMGPSWPIERDGQRYYWTVAPRWTLQSVLIANDLT